MIASPRPVGTIMNMYHAWAPIDFASLQVAAMSCWFRLVKEELTMNCIPLRRNVPAARSVASKAPGCLRKSSCTAAVEPSSDREQIRIPDSFIFSTTSSVTSTPFVAMHIRNPFSVPYFAISKRSFRRSGSPPERTRTGLEISAMSSISCFASPSEKSESCEGIEDEARQWMQLRLHRPVTSHAIHFGMNSSLGKAYPFGGTEIFIIAHRRLRPGVEPPAPPISPSRRTFSRWPRPPAPRTTSTASPQPVSSGTAPCSARDPGSAPGIRPAQLVFREAVLLPDQVDPSGRGMERRLPRFLPGGPMVLRQRLVVPFLLEQLVPLVRDLVRLLHLPQARGLLTEDRFVESEIRVLRRFRVPLRDPGAGVVQPLLRERVGAEESLEEQGVLPPLQLTVEIFLQPHGAFRVVPRLHHVVDPQPVGLPLLVGREAVLEEGCGDPRQLLDSRAPPRRDDDAGDEHIRRQRPLITGQRMLCRHVSRLVAQYGGRFRLAGKADEQTPVDDDVPAGEGEGVGHRGVQNPVPVVEVGPVGDAGQPHPDVLDVRLQLPVAIEAALLLDGGSVRLRAQRRFFLLGEGDQRQLGPAGDGVDRAAIHAH